MRLFLVHSVGFRDDVFPIDTERIGAIDNHIDLSGGWRFWIKFFFMVLFPLSLALFQVFLLYIGDNVSRAIYVFTLKFECMLNKIVEVKHLSHKYSVDWAIRGYQFCEKWRMACLGYWVLMERVNPQQ